MMPSWCGQENWGNCGIPWVNCAVLCVKDDWKDSSEACVVACQNCAVYSGFPSGMTSQRKIAQFNWESIAPLTAELSRQGLRSVLYFSSVIPLRFSNTVLRTLFTVLHRTIQVRRSAAGWGIALQAKMSRVRFPCGHWKFFIGLIVPTSIRS